MKNVIISLCVAVLCMVVGCSSKEAQHGAASLSPDANTEAVQQVVEEKAQDNAGDGAKDNSSDTLAVVDNAAKEKSKEAVVRKFGDEIIPDGFDLYGEPSPMDNKLLSEIQLVCIQEGCKCGDQVCQVKDICLRGVCMQHVCVTDEMSDVTLYKCNRAEGCKCGSKICPEGSICEHLLDLYSPNSSEKYVCFKSNIEDFRPVREDGAIVDKYFESICKLNENDDMSMIYVEDYENGKLSKSKKGKI